MKSSARTWTWALVLSGLAHGLMLALPSPGRATQGVSSRELKLRLEPLEPPPKPEPPPEPEPEIEPPPPSEPPKPQPTPRPEPVPVEPPPAPAEPPPAPAEPPAEAPAPAPKKDVDLSLKPRWSDPGSAVRRVRGRVRAEAEAAPPGIEPTGQGRFIFQHPGFDARIERDGSVRFRDKASFKFRGLVSDIDFTEIAMKIAKDDPFRSEKLAFLEQTRDFRSELREKADEERMKQAQRDALARVQAIWRGPGTPVERRRRLFEVWDGCVESGSEARVEAGRFVRRTVLGFIERTLPAEHPEGFSRAELARLNASRKSEARFTPYDGAEGS